MSNEQLNSTFKKTRSVMKVLSQYHSYQVIGENNFPANGPFILLNNHSLATYDGFLLGLKIFDLTGRLPKALGDDMLFNFSPTKYWCERIGIIPASPKNAKQALLDGEILALAPGGMIESLRSSKERYKIKWNSRKGFIKLALEAQVPIVLAACPQADKIFHVYNNPITDFMYDKFKFPLPIFRGLGPTLIPRPVKLWHYVSEPIIPPKVKDISKEVINSLHHEVVTKMNKLILDANNFS